MATIKDRDQRNTFTGISQEEYLRMKERIRMAKFKVTVFKRALYNEKAAYKKLLSTQPKRIERWHPKYDSRKKLDEDYVVGKMTNEEYAYERYAIWHVYSDRGHLNNIKWLEEMLQYYEDALQAINDELEDRRKARIKRGRKRELQKKHHASQMRKFRRRKKRNELEERWRKYGIG